MRLFQLEIKMVLKTRMTWILLGIAFMLSFLMAYIPATFPRYTYQEEKGQSINLKGLEVFHRIKEQRNGIYGEVTPQKIRKAVEVCQYYLDQYEAETIYGLPAEIYYSELITYEPFFERAEVAFSDPDTGQWAELSTLDPAEVEAFYEKCTDYVKSLMDREQGSHSVAYAKGVEMYEKVSTPFYYDDGAGGESMDYQTLLMFLITIFCVMIVAPVFSSEYQTGADDILRCTRYGRRHLGMTKVFSALTICGIFFLLCGTIWILTTNGLFGWEGTKSSIQMIFSVSNFLNLNIGQLEWSMMFGGFLCLLSILSFTLFLSSRMKSTVSSMGTALLFCVLPLLVYFAVPGMPGKWIHCILPGSGIGLQNSLLYAVTGREFLRLGSLSFWSPYVILTAAAVEIPVFIGLTIYCYCHQRA